MSSVTSYLEVVPFRAEEARSTSFQAMALAAAAVVLAVACLLRVQAEA